jgi:cyclophilin family peptidyl-prolyl cis-trans isomerase/HEAT repeat protein
MLIKLSVLFLAFATAGQGNLRGTQPGVPQAPFLRRDVASRVQYTRILEAEDKRVYAKELADMLLRPHVGIRVRAAMAIGRIGDPLGVQPLLDRLGSADAKPLTPAERDLPRPEHNAEVRAAIVFALGEIVGDLEDSRVNSVAGPATAKLLEIAAARETPGDVRARAVEALGKIGGNPRAATVLGAAQVQALAAAVADAMPPPDRDVVGDDLLLASLGITALMRIKHPSSAEPLAARLAARTGELRWQAANAIARVRPEPAPASAAAPLAAMLKAQDPLERANAARALAAVKAPGALAALVPLLSDDDERVQANAVRALAALGDAKAAAPVESLGARLLDDYRRYVAEKLPGVPPEQNLLLVVAEALGTLKAPSSLPLLKHMRVLDGRAGANPETEIAVAAYGEQAFFDVTGSAAVTGDWRRVASYAQGLGALGGARATRELVDILAGKRFGEVDARAVPDALTALAKLKPEGLERILVDRLSSPDVVVRGTAAGLLGEQFAPASEEVLKALDAALAASAGDAEPDARLAILEGIAKYESTRARDLLSGALNDPDYVVRRKAADLLQTAGVGMFRTKVPPALKPVRPKLYYERVERFMRDPSPVAIVSTEKGDIRLELLNREAPMTALNFVELAGKKYFDGIAFHRVVPNFVVQGGDPRGDGNGGPGYQIRCEINTVPYDRGAVGMALSGKDTGGSQFFFTHAPQPHLDGGYTVFAKVVSGMDVVDRLARGDRIVNVTILGGSGGEK